MKKKHVVSVISNKGGVGKTATAFHLGHALHRGGAKILWVDLNTNRNLTHSCLVGSGAKLLEGTLSEALTGDVAVEEVAVRLGEGMWLLPGDTRLVRTAAKMEPTQLLVLEELLERLEYDHAIIDTAGTTGSGDFLSTAALYSSTSCIIATQAEYAALATLPDLWAALDSVGAWMKKTGRRRFRVAGILPTRYVGTQHHEAALEELRRVGAERKCGVWEPIPATVDVSNALGSGAPCLRRSSRAGAAYHAATESYLRGVE